MPSRSPRRIPTNTGKELFFSGFNWNVDVPAGYPPKFTVESTIPYVEVPGSPEEVFSDTNSRVTRTLLCDWEDRWDFVGALMGYSFIVNKGASNAYIFRLNPDFYLPDTIGLDVRRPFWWATQILRMEGIGPGNSSGFNPWFTATGGPVAQAQTQPPPSQDGYFTYETCKLQVLYETLPYTVLENNDPNIVQTIDGSSPLANLPDESLLTRNVTRFIQPTAEFLTLPQGSYRFCNASKNPLVGSNGRIFSTSELNYTWHRVPTLTQEDVPADARTSGLPSAVFTSLGAINAPINAYENSSFNGFFPGTLLFLAAESKPYRGFYGFRYYDITYKMKFIPTPYDGRPGFTNNPLITVTSPPQPDSRITHNYFIDPTTFQPAGSPIPAYTYTLVTSDGNFTGTPVYRSADFRKLFYPQ